MKFTKTILSVGLVGVSLLGSLAELKAQDAKFNQLGNLSGATGTNAAIAAGVSLTNTIATSEYNSGKLQLAVRGNGAATFNTQVRTYRSLNSSKYETVATTNLLALNGTTEVSGIIDLSETYLANNATLRVVIDNTNASVVITQITAGVRFNAPSVRLKGQ